MKIKLIDIGRSHFTGEAEVKDLDGALREVKKYLLSSDVELLEHKKNDYFVLAGFHTVGELKIIEE